RRQRLAVLVVGKSHPAPHRLPAILHRVPRPANGMTFVPSAALIGVVVVLGLVLATVALAETESPATAVVRHAYFAPVLLPALRCGRLGGLLTGLTSVMLAAPFVLADVEIAGVGDALLAYPMLVLSGWLAGALVTGVRRYRERYHVVVATQSLLAESDDLADALERLRGPLAERLGGDLALVVRQKDGVLVVGGSGVVADSLADRVLASGVSAFVGDAGAGARPRRVFVAPLVARGVTIGVLAVERSGE